MIANKDNLYEREKLLALGEKLRENPQAIWLSVPVFVLALLIYSITKNRQKEAGAYGHLGLAFRLIYKHQIKSKIFLQISYALLSRAAEIGEGDGQPTVKMVMGSIAMETENVTQALEDYKSAYQMAVKIRDKYQAAFIQSHLASAQIKQNDLITARRNLDQSLRILSQGVRREPKSMRLQAWISNAELRMGEWYLAQNMKDEARLWANKAAKRAQIQNLKTRSIDTKNLLKKINDVFVTLIFSDTVRNFWNFAFQKYSSASS